MCSSPALHTTLSAGRSFTGCRLTEQGPAGAGPVLRPPRLQIQHAFSHPDPLICHLIPVPCTRDQPCHMHARLDLHSLFQLGEFTVEKDVPVLMSSAP